MNILMEQFPFNNLHCKGELHIDVMAFAQLKGKWIYREDSERKKHVELTLEAWGSVYRVKRHALTYKITVIPVSSTIQV